MPRADINLHCSCVFSPDEATIVEHPHPTRPAHHGPLSGQRALVLTTDAWQNVITTFLEEAASLPLSTFSYGFFSTHHEEHGTVL